jgi:hypothetical protein
VLLILLGLPFGALYIWQRLRKNIFALILICAALAYFPMLAMRFTPQGWETSNRSSQFLFVGISFVIALGIVNLRIPRRISSFAQIGLTLYVLVIFLGGMATGWQPNARLARPYLVGVGTSAIEPQGVTAARWTRSFLGEDNAFATDTTNARLLLAYGEQRPYTGAKYGIKAMLRSRRVGRSEQYILQLTNVRYIAYDRRVISWDHMIGVYFNHLVSGFSQETELIEPQQYAKFDAQKGVSRIFDSGNIIMYDVKGLVDGPQIK